jgi:hypothetical protein
MNPPEHAVVLCVDEKAQIQALDRTQPLLPPRPGQIERRTHDYTRHGTKQVRDILLSGTTSLVAALDIKTSQILSQLHRHHRSIEFRKFRDGIDAAVPAGLAIHLIVDSYGTHQTALIQRWLARRPRFQLQYSMRTLCSTYPRSRRPSRNATARRWAAEGVPGYRNPTRHTFPPCCASAASGAATSPRARLLTNARRSITR